MGMKAIRRGLIPIAILLASIALFGGALACNTQNTDTSDDAISIVKSHLEAKSNNDYEAWKSMLWRAQKDEQNFHPLPEKPGGLGVISLAIEKVEVSETETQRMKERYSGSDLARNYGWSDEYISTNMIVVSTQYTVDYDNTKVPYNEGTMTQDFILVRDDPNSPWLI